LRQRLIFVRCGPSYKGRGTQTTQSGWPISLARERGRCAHAASLPAWGSDAACIVPAKPPALT